jgi:hypothetical protein
VPAATTNRTEVLAALKKKIELIGSRYPGVAIQDQGQQVLISIPDRYRVDHEGHFAQVTENFLGYLRNPQSLPGWEKANMLAKYYATTTGVELSRKR